MVSVDVKHHVYLVTWVRLYPFGSVLHLRSVSQVMSVLHVRVVLRVRLV